MKLGTALRRRSQGVWALGLALLLPTGALAKELWRSEAKNAVLEAQAFYKTSLTSVWLSPALVEGAARWSALLEEVRSTLPSEQAELLPSAASLALPKSALVSTHAMRGSVNGRWGERWSAEAAFQLGLLVASHPALAAGGSGLTGSSASELAAAGASISARRRFADLPSSWGRWGAAAVAGDASSAASSLARLEPNLDRLAVKVALPLGDLTVGRQALSWGTGRLWNPTDVLSPFPPTAVDREVRRGFDAARLAVALGDVTQLDVLVLPQQKLADAGGVLRLQGNVTGWDASISAGKYVSDLLFGADLVGDVGPLGVHAEGAYTVGLSGLGQAGASVEVAERFFRGVAGVDWRPTEKLLLMGEYHFNGYGAASPAGYVERMTSERVLRGEVFGAGRHYFGLVAAYQAHELLNLQGTVLANLADPSVLFVPSLEYSFEQTVLVRAGGYLPLGAGPDVSAFSGLTLAELAANPRALDEARRTLGLRSEYGAASYGGFVQVGLYLP